MCVLLYVGCYVFEKNLYVLCDVVDKFDDGSVFVIIGLGLILLCGKYVCVFVYEGDL